MKCFAGRTRAVCIAALSASLAACGSGGSGGAAADPASAAKADRKEQMVDEIATTLQACSYEGKSLHVNPASLARAAPDECRTMVDRIMQYTGLPQNFVVAAGPVPNAMAAIMLDDQRVPRRVIAFNPDFITQVKAATGGDDWAPVSIMAHEIGHHLSGHTITEGHSRPEIELEADKFSGYVLYKMGAPLADSTRAILAIGSPTDQPTHPGRDRRAAAITQGWQEACRQTGTDCASGAASTPSQGGPPPQTAQAAQLPPVSATTIPFKYGRFVVDESRLLDREQVAALEKRLFTLAQQSGVEISLLLVKDLRGMSADDYAWTMMRQLRVGKLDVGNGAVLVVAPAQNQAAAALGPGVAQEMQYAEPVKQLERWIAGAWPVCNKPGGCRGWTETLFMVPESIARNTEKLEWAIRYQGVGEFMAVYLKDFEAKSKLPSNREYDPKAEVAFGKILRFRGKVVNLDTPVGIPVIKPEVLSNAAIVKNGYRPVHVQSEDGYRVVFYLHPRVAALMPGGMLEVGKQYTFVGRIQSPNPLKGQAQHVWALSYDAL